MLLKKTEGGEGGGGGRGGEEVEGEEREVVAGREMSSHQPLYSPWALLRKLCRGDKVNTKNEKIRNKNSDSFSNNIYIYIIYIYISLSLSLQK